MDLSGTSLISDVIIVGSQGSGKIEGMMKTIVYLLLTCFSFYAFAQAPVPEFLLNAKAAYVINEGATARHFDDFYSELKRWGRFEFVQEKEKADVVIVLSTRSDDFTVVGSGGSIVGTTGTRHYIRITKASDDAPLWADTTGEWRTNPRNLVLNLKQRMGKRQ